VRAYLLELTHKARSIGYRWMDLPNEKAGDPFEKEIRLEY
jgi:hypothetical protein